MIKTPVVNQYLMLKRDNIIHIQIYLLTLFANFTRCETLCLHQSIMGRNWNSSLSKFNFGMPTLKGKAERRIVAIK